MQDRPDFRVAVPLVKPPGLVIEIGHAYEEILGVKKVHSTSLPKLGTGCFSFLTIRSAENTANDLIPGQDSNLMTPKASRFATVELGDELSF
jgi:hypothetical protein